MEFVFILFHLICEIFLNDPRFNMNNLKNWNIIGYVLIGILCFAMVLDLFFKIYITLEKSY